MYHIFVAVSMAMSQNHLGDDALKHFIVKEYQHNLEKKNTETKANVAGKEVVKIEEVKANVAGKEVVKIEEVKADKLINNLANSNIKINESKGLNPKTTEDILKNLRKEETKRKRELTKLEKENLESLGLDPAGGEFASESETNKNSANVSVDSDFSSAKNKAKVEVKKVDPKSELKVEVKANPKVETKTEVKPELKKVDDKINQDQKDKSVIIIPDLTTKVTITDSKSEEKNSKISEEKDKNVEKKSEEKTVSDATSPESLAAIKEKISNSQNLSNSASEIKNETNAESQALKTPAQLAKEAKIKARADALKAKEDKKQLKLANLRKEYLEEFSKTIDLKQDSDFTIPKKKVLPKFIVYSIPEPLLERSKSVENRHNPDLVTQAEHINFMFDSIAKNRMDDFRSLYDIIRNPNIINSKGDTLLIFAIFMQRYEAIAALLSNGANPNLKNQLGYTPLNTSIEMSDYIATELLVMSGANLKYADSFGINYLMQAIKVGYFPIVDFLIEAGMNINLSDHDGFTALDFAIRNNDKILIKYLQKLGAKTGVDTKKQNIRKDKTLIEELQNRWK